MYYLKNKFIILIIAIMVVLLLFSCRDRRRDARTNRNEQIVTSAEPKIPPIPKESIIASVVHLTKADFFAKIADCRNYPVDWKYLGNKPAIIDFYADWCGPCKIIAPTLEKLAIEYAGKIIIYKVNIDNEGELALIFNIEAIPALLFIPLDEHPQMIVGALSEEDFKKNIDNYLLK